MAVVIGSAEENTEAIALARALLKSNVSWKEVATILKGINEDPEGLRRLILAYASTVCLSASPVSGKAFIILDIFNEPFYNTGKPGLVRACYEVVHA